MVGFPNKPMGFPTKSDHFGVFWGYHHWMKQPYIYIYQVRISTTCIFWWNNVFRSPDRKPPKRPTGWNTEEGITWRYAQSIEVYICHPMHIIQTKYISMQVVRSIYPTPHTITQTVSLYRLCRKKHWFLGGWNMIFRSPRNANVIC